MCVAITKPSGIEISEEILSACLTANPDGFGLAYPTPDKSRVIVKKGLWKLSQITAALAPLKDSPALIHFRWTTHGGTSAPNCHPFVVRKDLALVHNGILPVYPTRADFSDTRHFVQEMRSLFFQPDWTKKLPKIEEWHGGGNRLGLIDSQGKFYRTGSWSKHEGCKFSNLNWQTSSSCRYSWLGYAAYEGYEEDDYTLAGKAHNTRDSWTRNYRTTSRTLTDNSTPTTRKKDPELYTTQWLNGVSYMLIEFSYIDIGDRFRFNLDNLGGKEWTREDAEGRISVKENGLTTFANGPAATQAVWYRLPSTEAERTTKAPSAIIIPDSVARLAEPTKEGKPVAPLGSKDNPYTPSTLPLGSPATTTPSTPVGPYITPPENWNNSTTCQFKQIPPGGYFTWGAFPPPYKTVGQSPKIVRLCQRSKDNPRNYTLPYGVGTHPQGERAALVGFEPSPEGRVFPQPDNAPELAGEPSATYAEQKAVDRAQATKLCEQFARSIRLVVSDEPTNYPDLPVGELYVINKTSNPPLPWRKGLTADYRIGLEGLTDNVYGRNQTTVYLAELVAEAPPVIPSICPGGEWLDIQNWIAEQKLRPTESTIPSVSCLYGELAPKTPYQTVWNGPVFLKTTEGEHDPGCGVYAGHVETVRPLAHRIVWLTSKDPKSINSANEQIKNASLHVFRRLPVGAICQRFKESPQLRKVGPGLAEYVAPQLGAGKTTISDHELVWTACDEKTMSPLETRDKTPALPPPTTTTTTTTSAPKSTGLRSAEVLFDDVPYGCAFAYEGRVYRKRKKEHRIDLETLKGKTVKVLPNIARIMEKEKKRQKRLIEIIEQIKPKKGKTEPSKTNRPACAYGREWVD